MDLGSENLQKFLIVMDSMTDDELDCIVPLDDSRIRRVARGSGQPEIRVRQMLQMSKQFMNMIGKLGKSGMLKNEGALQQQMKRNPNRAMADMARAMDPRMLQQMGGMGGIQQVSVLVLTFYFYFFSRDNDCIIFLESDADHPTRR